MNRRAFLALTTGGLAVAAPSRGVSIAIAPSLLPPVLFAVKELEAALAAHGVILRTVTYMDQAPAGDLGIDAGVNNSPYLPKSPEAVSITLGRQPNREVLHVAGADSRGLGYGILDLADRVRHAENPYDALDMRAVNTEQPANSIRGIMKCFVSDVEDKPWYNDREQWPRYLTMLASNRFNRFNLAFGVGYDFTREIRDCYFHFAYPFLLDVPGYKVRAKGLPDAERDGNLAMLKFISAETAARGIHFQLGLWTHAYEWTESPHANYTFTGLTKQNHAAYCRDALKLLLKECPAISGVTLRVHGESGVAEGDYGFWKTLFEGITGAGRKIEIDMHAKGMDDGMIETALATGLPVNISPKYMAEHMGLPYHQAGIREMEMPPEGRRDQGFFGKSNGSRKFLRYGYGDLLADGRRYGVLHRIWPGTQRMLLWGDPAMAAAYSRESSFCGSAGLELFEPLSFKGRKGSGLPGGRLAYADKSLEPRGGDWEKYLYTYRVWGRHLYNPNCGGDAWRRQLRKEFGAGSHDMEEALASASRILPVITNAHGPSAANNNYWPELYTNMSLIADAKTSPYKDTADPKRFGTVSPFDPELFATCEEPPSYKYSALDVANWLDGFASTASASLEKARRTAADPQTIEFRRADADIEIQIRTGRFFAAKLRAAVFRARGDSEGCLEEYGKARGQWELATAIANRVYRRDITYGFEPQLRGSWQDRLAAIDRDIALLATGAGKSAAAPPGRFGKHPECVHTPPARFIPGQPLKLELASVEELDAVILHYRHVDQSEHFRTAEMTKRFSAFSAVVPAAYTQSPFDLIYYFELRRGELAWALPGLGADLFERPYHLCARAATRTTRTG